MVSISTVKPFNPYDRTGYALPHYSSFSCSAQRVTAAGLAGARKPYGLSSVDEVVPQLAQWQLNPYKMYNPPSFESLVEMHALELQLWKQQCDERENAQWPRV